ncbi:MAG: GNAT family N-acetyltransferase [Egibacteraceae bacterium]
MFLAGVDELDRPVAPIAGLTISRTLGVNGTRFAALLANEMLGYIEVDNRIGDAGRIARHDGWADVGNLFVVESHRRRGIASWLLGQAADWLRLGHVDRLLDYSTPEQEGYIAFLQHAGFHELTRTTRGWARDPHR